MSHATDGDSARASIVRSALQVRMEKICAKTYGYLLCTSLNGHTGTPVSLIPSLPIVSISTFRKIVFRDGLTNQDRWVPWGSMDDYQSLCGKLSSTGAFGQVPALMGAKTRGMVGTNVAGSDAEQKDVGR